MYLLSGIVLRISYFDLNFYSFSVQHLSLNVFYFAILDMLCPSKKIFIQNWFLSGLFYSLLLEFMLFMLMLWSIFQFINSLSSTRILGLSALFISGTSVCLCYQIYSFVYVFESTCFFLYSLLFFFYCLNISNEFLEIFIQIISHLLFFLQIWSCLFLLLSLSHCCLYLLIFWVLFYFEFFKSGFPPGTPLPWIIESYYSNESFIFNTTLQYLSETRFFLIYFNI